MKENAKLVWWPLMDKEIDAKTAECVTCIRNGKNLKTKLNSKQIGKLKTLTAPNQELQIDFYGPFKYKSKKKYLLVSVDRFSKWVHIKLVEKTGTSQVIKFLKQIIADTGTPEVMKSDNTACFRNDQYRNFLKSQSIKPEFVTPYVHTGNGTIERTIGTIDSYKNIS